MPGDPIDRYDEFSTSTTPEEAAIRATRCLSQVPGGKIRTADSSGEATLGSRAALHFWGLWSPWARKQLPVLVKWTTEPTNDGTRIAVEMHSDYGWSVIAKPILRWAYEDRFDELTDELRDAVT